jgi:hypothetical protein
MANITWISIVKGMQVAPGLATLDDRNPGDGWEGMNTTEVDVHLRLLVTSGAIDSVRAQRVIQSFDEVRAMTWRLLHPR